MKKSGFFVLLFALGLFGYGVKADVLPDYNRTTEKIVNGKNVLNVADFPDWDFYVKTVSGTPGSTTENTTKIGNNGDLGCVSLYYHVKEITAHLKDSQCERITVFSDGALNGKLIGCNQVVNSTYSENEKINYIIITPDKLSSCTASSSLSPTPTQPLQPTQTPTPTPSTPNLTTITSITPSVEIQTSASVPPITTISTSRATPLQQREYGEEILQAFTYAHEMKITTIADIDKANIWGNLTRAQAAKMLSQFAIEVLKKTPDISKSCIYPDIQGQGDLTEWIVTSCQLGLMGVGIQKFTPTATMTRAEFGTVLSRALRGDTYDTQGEKYYTQHLQQLQKLGIMTSIANPMVLEKRGYVMLMLMRLHQTLAKI